MALRPAVNSGVNTPLTEYYTWLHTINPLPNLAFMPLIFINFYQCHSP